MITQENIPYTADEIKAMVKTCEKYNKALERAKDMLTYEEVRREDMEYLFPEIKEPEDEKIKREIRNFIWGYPDKLPKRDKWLNWLEKQRKQPTDNIEPNPAWSEEDGEMLTWLCRIIHTQRLDKAITLKEESELGKWIDKWLNYNPQTKKSEQSTDKIKTKFNEGDYIVPLNVTPLEIWKVVNIDKDGYYNIQPITNIINTEDDEIYRVPAFTLEEDYYLWSINDTKKGDVLVDEYNNIGIYSGEKDDLYWHSCIYLGCDEYLRCGDGYHKRKNTKPATKEQRDLLFSKMKQEGYEYNDENKKVSKQTLKITPKFCVGQVITDDNGNWYKITNIKCLDDWYYELYDVCENNTHHELCSIIDDKFRENCFVNEIKKMIGD